MIFHVAIGASIGLVIPGSLSAIYDAPTPSNPKPGDNLVLAGISLFVVCWFGLCFLVAVLNKTAGKLDLEKKVKIKPLFKPVAWNMFLPNNVISYFSLLPSARHCLEFESYTPY